MVKQKKPAVEKQWKRGRGGSRQGGGGAWTLDAGDRVPTGRNLDVDEDEERGATDIRRRAIFEGWASNKVRGGGRWISGRLGGRAQCKVKGRREVDELPRACTSGTLHTSLNHWAPSRMAESKILSQHKGYPQAR